MVFLERYLFLTILIHACIFFSNFTIFWSIYPSGFCHTPMTSLDWCGYNLSIFNFSLSLFNICMYPALYNSIICAFPSVNPYFMGWKYPLSVLIWQLDTQIPHLQPSNFPGVSCGTSHTFNLFPVPVSVSICFPKTI